MAVCLCGILTVEGHKKHWQWKKGYKHTARVWPTTKVSSFSVDVFQNALDNIKLWVDLPSFLQLMKARSRQTIEWNVGQKRPVKWRDIYLFRGQFKKDEVIQWTEGNRLERKWGVRRCGKEMELRRCTFIYGWSGPVQTVVPPGHVTSRHVRRTIDRGHGHSACGHVNFLLHGYRGQNQSTHACLAQITQQGNSSEVARH